VINPEMASRFIRFNAPDYRIYEQGKACLTHKLQPEHAIDVEKQASLNAQKTTYGERYGYKLYHAILAGLSGCDCGSVGRTENAAREYGLSERVLKVLLKTA
jgi:hypothetical protein